MQACVRCHQRKVRCDKQSPCKRCEVSGLSCEYNIGTRERLYSQDHLDRLENRLRRLEARNKLLSRELARARSDVSARSPTVSSLSPTASQPTGAFTNEVSTLAIDASGERQYLGSASGVLLADCVRAHVGTGNPQVPAAVLPTPAGSGGVPKVAVPISREYECGWAGLPSRELVQKLVAAYLDHDYVCYPLLHPAFLLSAVDGIYGTGKAFYDENPFESFALNMVLAIATTHVLTSDWQMVPSAESHHARAVSSVQVVLQQGGLRSLQAILLLTQYRMSSSAHDDTASMWHLVGIAMRVAIQMGLHREDMYPRQRVECASGDDETAKLIQQEISRNCFWSAIAMDRIVSNILGRPFSIQMQDVDAQLPSTDSDDIMSLCPDEDSASYPDTSGSSAIFVHVVQYRILCGKIVTTMHGRPGQHASVEDMVALRSSLGKELAEWERQTGQLDLPPDSASVSCFRTRTWFSMLLHNAKLMLYRPSPKLDVSQDVEALQNIFSSAKQSITLYSALHRSRRLNHSWPTLQALFVSGLSYIYAASMHFRQRQRSASSASSQPSRQSPLRSDPTTLEVINDTRACSNVLSAVSERQVSFRHCSDVFNRLSDAVLTDVIKFECISRSSSHGSGSTTPHRRRHLSLHPPAPDSGPPQDTAQTPMSPWHYAAPLMDDMETGSSPLSQLAVEAEFRHTFDDLQFLYDREQVDYSVSQLSQAWYDSFNFAETQPSGTALPS